LGHDWLDCDSTRSDAFSSSLFRLMDGEWPFQRGNQILSARAVWIGANDARHREHLMAPARQLTSSASLKSKSCGAKPCLLKSDRSSRESFQFVGAAVSIAKR